ncbi:MAG: PilZ domain-containing protein, partial [Polyangiaceae bacterium]
GKTPYDGNYAQILLAMESNPQVRFPEGTTNVPVSLQAVLERALSKAPQDRHPSMEEFGGALRSSMTPLPDHTSLLGLRREPPTLPPTSTRDSKTLIDVPIPARRKHPRAPYVTPVRVLEAEGRHVDGRTEDISEGGLLVLAERPCEVAKVSVRFALPISGKIVSVEAEPRWVQRARGAAIGLRFLELDPEACTEIRGYVSAMGGVS